MERRKVTVGSLSLEAAKVKVGAVEIKIWPPEASEKIRRAWARRREGYFYPLGLGPRKRKRKAKESDDAKKSRL